MKTTESTKITMLKKRVKNLKGVQIKNDKRAENVKNASTQNTNDTKETKSVQSQKSAKISESKMLKNANEILEIKQSKLELKEFEKLDSEKISESKKPKSKVAKKSKIKLKTTAKVRETKTFKIDEQKLGNLTKSAKVSESKISQSSEPDSQNLAKILQAQNFAFSAQDDEILNAKLDEALDSVLNILADEKFSESSLKKQGKQNASLSKALQQDRSEPKNESKGAQNGANAKNSNAGNGGANAGSSSSNARQNSSDSQKAQIFQNLDSENAAFFDLESESDVSFIKEFAKNAQKENLLESLIQKREVSESKNQAQIFQNLNLQSTQRASLRNVLARENMRYFSESLREEIKNYKPPFTTISLDLKPRNLGALELTITKRGKDLQVSVTSNASAINLFMQSQNDLRTQLSQVGFDNVNLSFSQSGSNQQNSGNGADSQNARNFGTFMAQDDLENSESRHENGLSQMTITIPQYA